MVVLQILFKDGKIAYVKELLIKAQGSFQMSGEKYTLGRTLLRVLEEWCKSKGYIKDTKASKDGITARDLIKEDVEEYDYVIDLMRQVRRDPNEANGRMLHEYLLRMEPDWKAPKGVSFSGAVLERMEELMAR